MSVAHRVIARSVGPANSHYSTRFIKKKEDMKAAPWSVTSLKPLPWRVTICDAKTLAHVAADWS
jgi:hypothetical protein